MVLVGEEKRKRRDAQTGPGPAAALVASRPAVNSLAHNLRKLRKSEPLSLARASVSFTDILAISIASQASDHIQYQNHSKYAASLC